MQMANSRTFSGGEFRSLPISISSRASSGDLRAIVNENVHHNTNNDEALRQLFGTLLLSSSSGDLISPPSSLGISKRGNRDRSAFRQRSGSDGPKEAHLTGVGSRVDTDCCTCHMCPLHGSDPHMIRERKLSADDRPQKFQPLVLSNGSDNSVNSTTDNGKTSPAHADESEAMSLIRTYPWFHGTLSGIEASKAVCEAGSNGHGTFLVRQSETFAGGFVLTFNFTGLAKHLRLTLTSDGKVYLHHNHYNSIFEMLEHFRVSSIPFDHGGVEIKLVEYVVCWQRAPPGLQLPADAKAASHHVTYGGSFRHDALTVFGSLLFGADVDVEVLAQHVAANVYATNIDIV